MYTKYNDYELLYLIEEGSELAYSALVEKYEYLIRQKISDYHVKPKYWDDYVQECFYTLDGAIRIFDENKGKSFYSYFLMQLNFKIRKLLAQEKDYFYKVSLIEFPEIIEEQIIPYDEEKFDVEDYDMDFSVLELDVLICLSKGLKPREICDLYHLDSRKVYNAIARLKVKLKPVLNNGTQKNNKK